MREQGLKSIMRRKFLNYFNFKNQSLYCHFIAVTNHLKFIIAPKWRAK